MLQEYFLILVLSWQRNFKLWKNSVKELQKEGVNFNNRYTNGEPCGLCHGHHRYASLTDCWTIFGPKQRTLVSSIHLKSLSVSEPNVAGRCINVVSILSECQNANDKKVIFEATLKRLRQCQKPHKYEKCSPNVSGISKALSSNSSKIPKKHDHGRSFESDRWLDSRDSKSTRGDSAPVEATNSVLYDYKRQSSSKRDYVEINFAQSDADKSLIIDYNISLCNCIGACACLNSSLSKNKQIFKDKNFKCTITTVLGSTAISTTGRNAENFSHHNLKRTFSLPNLNTPSNKSLEIYFSHCNLQFL